jgi:hypothetical protein
MSKRPAGKHNTSQTATASTPEGEFQRHLRDLGLDSTDAYRAWCRKHGFGQATHKNWQERRNEIRLAQKQRAEETAAEEMRKHAERLGLNSLEEYDAWCVRHGFSRSLRKTYEQQKQEIRFADNERGRQALAGAKKNLRRPDEVIRALHDGEIDPADLKTPYLLKIAEVFKQTDSSPDCRAALLALLLHAQKHANLFGLDPVDPHFSRKAGNTFIDALLALARRDSDWIRPLEDWKPDSHSPRRQFGSLARHLLARYTVPAFIDTAWFHGSTPKAQAEQDWFRHIGIGKNIRTADIPVQLTKMAAHHFLLAPKDFTIDGAFRWGQIIALGGNEYLVRAVTATRLGWLMEDEPFWKSVIHFFVNNPMLDPACLGPMVDYIYNEKFAPQESIGDYGQVVFGPPRNPEFSMKGRTVPALLRLVETWHRQLAKETRKPVIRWEPSGIGSFSLTERDRDSEQQVMWTVEELLDSKSLNEEGKAMHHCVASYARSCENGKTSIWSLRVGEEYSKSTHRVMTIEVHNDSRKLVQARGRCNKTPGARQASERLGRTPRILKLWATQEGLTVPSHILQ